MTVERFADLAAEIARRPARLGRVRLVAVDGPSGSGKTTFALRLAAAVRRAGQRVETVHTDDLLDGWADQFTFWPRLEQGVLEPLARGEPGRYRVYDWVRACFGGTMYVPVPEVLILDGSTSARISGRRWLSLAVFLTADPEVRLERVLARDGPSVEEPLRRWTAAEDAHFARERTAERADRLVDGVAPVGHDPESEYLRLR